MSTYKTVRGKQVTLGNITLAVNDNGDLHACLARNAGPAIEFDVAEVVASNFYNLLGDVMEWDSSKGSTEAAMDRLGEAADREMESGKADDMHAPGNR